MQITRAWKTELDPTAAQRQHFVQACGVARFVYNWGLEQRKKRCKETGESMSAFSQLKLLCAIKHEQFPWMYEVSKCVPQYALRDLDSAYAHFFRRVKEGKQGRRVEKVGFPRFRSRRRGLGSFTVHGSIHVEERRVKLPRIG
jgi:putative transposase